MSNCDILELSLCDTIHDFSSLITNDIIEWYISDICNNSIATSGFCSNIPAYITELNNNKNRIETYCKNRYNINEIDNRLDRTNQQYNHSDEIWISDTHSSASSPKTFLNVIVNKAFHSGRSDPNFNTLFINILSTKRNPDTNIYITLDNTILKNYIIFLASLDNSINIINTPATICDRQSSICENNILTINKPITITSQFNHCMFFLDKYEIGNISSYALNNILCDNINGGLINDRNNIFSYSYLLNTTYITVNKTFKEFIDAKGNREYGNQYFGNISNTRSNYRRSTVLNGIGIIELATFNTYTNLITPINNIYNINERITKIRVIRPNPAHNPPPTHVAIDINRINRLIKMLFDFKRLGDYSQVLTAYRYNYIFMTEDRLASIYAYFLNVPCIITKKYNDGTNNYTKITFLNFEYTYSSSAIRPHARRRYGASKNKDSNKTKITSKEIFLKILQKYTFSKINKYFNQVIIILFMFLAYDSNLISNDYIEYTKKEKAELKILFKEFINKYLA